MMARSHKKRLTFILLIMFAAVSLVCVVLIIISSQLAAMDKLNAEYEALQEEYNFQKREEQQLEFMLDYVKSNDYLIQYARERFGFVLPDDIIFDIEE